jgi:Membrane bound O-acyl transferase family
MSTSLSEFWGVRWNPIIGKLLQESFYKPLRRFGVPRVWCIILCFAGSAMLHAMPQFLSTYSVSDCLMMASFFLGQGFLLLMELFFQRAAGLDKLEDASSPLKQGLVKFQFAGEWLTCTTILYICYLVLEKHDITTHTELSVEEISIALALLTVTATTVMTLINGDISDRVKSSDVRSGTIWSRWPRNLYFFLGWLWAVGSVITMLPLFSMPVYHAVESLYTRSLVVGPLIRTLSH